MIDVPELVKDALRDGRRLKQYRFISGDASELVLDSSGRAELEVDQKYYFYIKGSHPSVTALAEQKVGNQTRYTALQNNDMGSETFFYLEPFAGYSTLAVEFRYISGLTIYKIPVDTMITNDNLVAETVKFDERMCSGDVLKFGLCEGASLEFQYFDKPNLNGKRLRCSIEVQYKDAGSLKWYMIPMGYFTVDKCPMQFSTGIYKVTAYNKLKSSYLDRKANLILAETFSQDYEVTLFDIQKALLQDYEIFPDMEKISAHTSPGTVVANPQAHMGLFRFKETYGVNSPINSKMAGITSISTSFDLYAYSVSIPYVVSNDSGYIGIGALHGFIKGLEMNVYETLKSWIESADLRKQTSGYLWQDCTWEKVLDTICQGDGFQNIIGVYYSYTDEHGTFQTRTYSTIQWEYEEQYSLAHTVDGTMSDLECRMIDSSISQLGPMSINIYCPVGVYSGAYDMQLGFNGSMMANDGSYAFKMNYTYYTTGSYTTFNTVPSTPVKYSDGSDMIPGAGHDTQDSILVYKYSNLPAADYIKTKISDLPEFTLRDIISAVYETVCEYGKLDRESDLFYGGILNNSRLFPADNLYPDNALYPDGNAESVSKSTYSKLWTDEQGILKFKDLIITFKGLDENNQEQDFTLQRTVNADGNVNYNMSDNWIFRNLVWTKEKVGEYADAMASRLQDVSWIPFEMWCAGLPYLETGDELEITNRAGTFTSYILQRQLGGIQNLQDTYINGTLDIF